MNNLRKLMDLYLSFFKIGGFTIGGGLAMLPLIQQEVVDKKKWLTDDEFVDYVTISESLPGIISINTATAVGRKIAGFPGSFFATFGIVTPSLVIIMLIAAFFDSIAEIGIVSRAFTGIRAAVPALILAAVIRMGKKSVKTAVQLVLAIIVAIIASFFRIPLPYIILASALFGVVYGSIFLKNKSDGDKNDASD